MTRSERRTVPGAVIEAQSGSGSGGGDEMSEESLRKPATPVTISDEVFQSIVAERVQALLSLGGYLLKGRSAEDAMTRPFLGELLAQAIQVEDLLDTYGARNNRRWHLFRLQVATLLRFAEAGYELLHIQHASPSYRLLGIEQDFDADTVSALAFTGEVLRQISVRIRRQARRLGLPVPSDSPDFAENLPPGRLPQNCATRAIESVSETVTHLATAFLNLAAQSELVHVAGRARPEQYAACIPDPVSEESLRYLEHRFHNLQSLYDTFVSETETEVLDPHLPVLRGHISVVFHLLRTGTALVHYYERHVDRYGRPSAGRKPLVDPQALLGMLMNYSIAYASRYIACAQCLCQEMLKRYAEVVEIDVPAPRYRGLHVRPSTLIAKIVSHYGSEVSMELDGECYDASTPLEIFRANEKINARKRRWLVSEIARLPLALASADTEDVQTAARRIVITLAEQGKVVIYEQPLRMPERPVERKGTVLDWVVAEIARLQATAKIDINADLTITFRGDRRVLADVDLLANSGYGEDNFGNNIALPKELAYLRR